MIWKSDFWTTSKVTLQIASCDKTLMSNFQFERFFRIFDRTKHQFSSKLFLLDFHLTDWVSFFNFFHEFCVNLEQHMTVAYQSIFSKFDIKFKIMKCLLSMDSNCFVMLIENNDITKFMNPTIYWHLVMFDTTYSVMFTKWGRP